MIHHFHSVPKNVAEENSVISGRSFTPRYMPSSVIPKPMTPIVAKSRKEAFERDFSLSFTFRNTNLTDKIQLTASPTQKPSAVESTREKVYPMRAGGRIH